MDLLQRLDASHEPEGVMAVVVSTDIALEGMFLNQDTRLMVDQSNIGIARPAGRRQGICTGIQRHAHGQERKTVPLPVFATWS